MRNIKGFADIVGDEPVDWLVDVRRNDEMSTFAIGTYEELLESWLEGTRALLDLVPDIALVSCCDGDCDEASDIPEDSVTESRQENSDKDYEGVMTSSSEGEDTEDKGETPQRGEAGSTLDGNGNSVPVSTDRAIPYEEAELKVKAVLEATEHIISYAPVYDWMEEAKFVAWKGNQPLLVTFGVVNDGVTITDRIERLKIDLANWIIKLDRVPKNVGIVAFYVDGDHVTRVGDSE